MTKVKEFMRRIAIGFFDEGLLPNESVLVDEDPNAWSQAMDILKKLTLEAIENYHEEDVVS